MTEFPSAIRVIETVMEEGKHSHPLDDWRNKPASYHVARARWHLELLEAGDTSEPHLSHAACRVLMALELEAKR